MNKHRYTPEQIQWIRDNCRGLLYAEAWELFNAHYGLEISFTQFKGILFNYKITLGSLSRRKSLPDGATTGSLIKDNWKWVGISKFLRLKDLRKALKVLLKKTDKRLYTSMYGGAIKKPE